MGTDCFFSVILFRANFVLVEAIIQNKVKPFLIEFIGVVKTYFLTNSLFRLMESDFLFSRKSILLFTQFFLLAEVVFSCKIRFR